MTREEFANASRSLTGTMYLSKVLYSLDNLYQAQPDKKMPVIWLEVSGCGGNTISMLNAVGPNLNQILQGLIDLRFQNTLMWAEDNEAWTILDRTIEDPNGFLLIIEGAISTLGQGKLCIVAVKDNTIITGSQLITRIAPRARYVMAVGTCACFGGPSAAKPNPSKSVGVGEFLQRTVINVSGCPAHPDWIIGTLAHLLLFGEPEVDQYGRPVIFYGETVHRRCTRRSFFDQRIFAKELGDPECMFELGCKGPLTHADCPERQWNSYLNWPVKANTPCIGCTEPTYPDGMEPFFEPPFPLDN
jgi:hydrogenase small subunit